MKIIRARHIDKQEVFNYTYFKDRFVLVTALLEEVRCVIVDGAPGG